MLPMNQNTTEHAIESRIIVDTPRSYLGMSGLGDPCSRKIWLGWRWASPKQYPARVKRIFNRGDLEEARIIADLKEVGIEVYRKDPTIQVVQKGDDHIELFGHIGERQEELIGFAGHVKGHTDGRLLGVIEAPKTEHLAEFKTANAKGFKKFKDLGVKEAHKVYYGQLTRYMGGLNLTRAMFIVNNKDTEERHYERVKFDKYYYADLVRKEVEIVLSELPPEKEFAKTWFECKFCDQRAVCHNGATPQVNCRTCEHVDLHDKGRWTCGLNQKDLTFDDQLKGCELYKRLF